MRKKVAIVAMLGLIIFFGCKKKSNPAAPASLHFGTVYDDSSHVLYYYYYAPDGRISGMHDNKGKYWTYYHYNGKQIEAKETVYGNNTILPAIIYLVGSAGLADSSYEVYSNGATGIRKKFGYDANGYLVNVRWYSAQNIFVLSENMAISNGNITNHSYTPVDTNDQSLPRGFSAYQYYSDKSSTLGNLYSGQDFLGTSSKNPVKSWSYTLGSTTSTSTYTYNYDNSNYITSQLAFRDSAGVSLKSDSISFVYYGQ